MIKIRKSEDRGHYDYDWLNTYHTFSFNEYYDTRFMGFRSLRVLNEDRVQPGRGFGLHGHRNMEILTLVLEGSLEHKDSMGNGSVLTPGRVQYMSAGTGIRHSETNPSSVEPVHLYQIWIEPREEDLTPRYEEIDHAGERSANRWKLAASPDGREDSLVIQQDVSFYTAALDKGTELLAAERPGSYDWIQCARGEIEVNGQPLRAGDGAALSQESFLTVKAVAPSEVMWFNLT